MRLFIFCAACYPLLERGGEFPLKELSEEAKIAKRAYEKQWRQNNPDKVREIRRRFWEKKAANLCLEVNDDEKECCSIPD